MSFLYSQNQECPPKRQRLGLNGRRIRKLQKRGRTFKRLQLLKEFNPGHVYSFAPIQRLDLLDEDLLLWADEIEQECRHAC